MSWRELVDGFRLGPEAWAAREAAEREQRRATLASLLIGPREVISLRAVERTGPGPEGLDLVLWSEDEERARVLNREYEEWRQEQGLEPSREQYAVLRGLVEESRAWGAVFPCEW